MYYFKKKFIDAIVIIMGCLPIGHSALGEDLSMTEEHYYESAHALRVIGFSGQLDIQAANLAGIRLNLSGSKENLAAITRAVDGDTLEITQKSPAPSSTTIVGDGTTVIVTGPGASASVTIGERTVEVEGDRPRLQAMLQLPPGSPVSIEELTGTATIGDLGGPLRVSVISGDLRAGHSGDATIHIEGSGDIRVLGRAERAELSVSGSGDIRVAQVRNQPRVSLSGSGEISVDNW